MDFSDLQAFMAVDINPDTFEKYRPDLIELGHTAEADKYHLYGKYLVVTSEGYQVVEPITFHRIWKFYTPDQADRTAMRTIINRD